MFVLFVLLAFIRFLLRLCKAPFITLKTNKRFYAQRPQLGLTHIRIFTSLLTSPRLSFHSAVRFINQLATELIVGQNCIVHCL